MSQTRPDSSRDFLCDCLESCLSESGISYARRMRNKQKDAVFNIVLSSPEEDLIDQRILVCVHENLLYLEAPVCITGSDRTDLAMLVNTLNNRYAIGAFQYSPRRGIVGFAHFVAARDGVWPGNEAVCEALALAQRMSAVLYHEMMSDEFPSPAIDG